MKLCLSDVQCPTSNVECQKNHSVLCASVYPVAPVDGTGASLRETMNFQPSTTEFL